MKGHALINSALIVGTWLSQYALNAAIAAFNAAYDPPSAASSRKYKFWYTFVNIVAANFDKMSGQRSKAAGAGQ